MELRVIILLCVSAVIFSMARARNTTKPYSKTFDYISNGLLTGTANDKTVFEISPTTLAKANLTTLLDWIQWMEDMQIHVQKLKKSAPEYDFHCYIHMDELAGDENKAKRIDAMLRALQYYQERTETELRKPEKAWNYPSDQ